MTASHVLIQVYEYPATAAHGFDVARCALRPCTADGLPALGPAPGLPGLFVVTGGAKMGMTLGPACGRLAAEWLTEGRPSLDLPGLGADRF